MTLNHSDSDPRRASGENVPAADKEPFRSEPNLPELYVAPAISPEITEILSINIAAAVIAMGSGRYKTEAHCRSAQREAHAGYLNQGSTAQFIKELADITELSAARSPAMQRFYEVFNQAGSAIAWSDVTASLDDKRAAGLLDAEAFEDNAGDILKTNPELQGEVTRISSRLIDRLKRTNCYQRVCREYESDAANQRDSEVSKDLEKLSQLFLTLCVYTNLIFHQHSVANHDMITSSIPSTILSTSVALNVLQSFPDRSMAQDVLDVARDHFGTRVNMNYCEFKNSDFRFCLKFLAGREDFLNQCADAFKNLIDLPYTLEVIREQGFRGEQIVRPLELAGSLRIICRLGCQENLFLAIERSGFRCMDHLKVIETFRDSRLAVSNRVSDEETHYVLCGGRLSLRADDTPVLSLFSSLATVEGISSQDIENLADTRHFFDSIIQRLREGEPELFSLLRGDRYLTFMVNQTNVVILPHHTLRDEVESLIRGEYFALPLAETDLAGIVGGRGDSVVFVLPAGDDGLEQGISAEEAAAEEKIGEAPASEREAALPTLASEFRDIIRRRYHTFPSFLKALQQHGALMTSQGKGSHMAITFEGRIATVCQRIRSETEPFKPFMAKQILGDLGISLADAVSWL